ncbi:hypothetical protein D9M73_78620 [compost metagenome]
MAGLRFPHTHEKQREPGRIAAGFNTVLFIVMANAEDFSGLRDHRQELNLVQRNACGTVGRCGDFLEFFRPQRT